MTGQGARQQLFVLAKNFIGRGTDFKILKSIISRRLTCDCIISRKEY